MPGHDATRQPAAQQRWFVLYDQHPRLRHSRCRHGWLGHGPRVRGCREDARPRGRVIGLTARWHLLSFPVHRT
ncbi:MAG TPA: hypothetical protein VGI74_08980 [Streptosporangiaceae bacterium]